MTKLSKLKSKIAVLRAFTNSSSFVGNMRYDQDEQSITGILSGKHYKWCGVPERKFDSFEGAGSPGAFFNRELKAQYDCSGGGILSNLKSRTSKHKNEMADNVLNLSADSIMNKFIQFKKNNKEWKTLIGTFDPLQGNIIDARVPAGAMRLQNIFGAKGKLAFNSVTDTRQGPVTDMDLILSQLKEIEQAGGIPSLGVFEGSLEATKALIDMTDTEILNDLLESQRSTQIIDPDTRLRIVDNVSFRQN